MGEDQITESDAEVLERFVVDNDDLLELEERIGRFNIFDSLGIARTEIRHSNFLAWLLDPAESHGQGTLFLNAVLMDLFKQAPPERRPLSPVDLDGLELRGVEIRREWRNIDILIICNQPRFVIAIENKIDAGEHSDQLQRYEDTLEREFASIPRSQRMHVFLTPEGDEPSDEDWVPYSYGDLHRVLDRCRRVNHGAIGDEVEVFLDHYLRLIGSRFMDDPKIDELCQRIYKNHKQALQLILERVGRPEAGLLLEIATMLREKPDEWHVFNSTSRRVDFIPKAWLSWLPPIGSKSSVDPRLWIVWIIFCTDERCQLTLEVWKTQDHETRFKAIERLCAEKDFGMKAKYLKPNSRRNRLSLINVAKWEEDDEPDSEKVLETLKMTLDEQLKRLATLPAVLRPILQRTSARNV